MYLYQIPLIKKSEMFNNFKLNTRMHSSTMRTTHSSTSQVCVGSASVHSGIQPLGCGPGDPPGVDLETPPRCGPVDTPGQTPQPPPGCGHWDPPARPLNLPLRCGPGNLHDMLGYTPLPQRPARHAGILPPRPYGQTDTCKNITFVICRR